MRVGDRCEQVQQPDAGTDTGPAVELCNGVDDDHDGVEDRDDPDAHARCDEAAGAESTAVCGGEECTPTSCSVGTGNCTSEPGCETDLTSTAEHCATCGHACAWSCESSECNDAVQLAGGLDFHCALRAGGTVVCWGRNSQGRLGDGTTLWRPRPVTVVNIADVVAITAGQNFACALRADESVSCWGTNERRELSAAARGLSYSPRPVQVFPTASGVQEVAAGQFHACVRFASGRVSCWGENADGQVGVGTFDSPIADPTDVGLEGVVSLVSGGYHVCVLRSAGEVVCWGANSGGQLGDGSALDRSAPPDTAVPGLSARALALGGVHSCAITSSGQVACWGQNDFGQLGSGSLRNAYVPTMPYLLDGVTSLALGDVHGCARVSEQLYCWGGNSSRQVGVDSFEVLTEPTALSMVAGAVEVSGSMRNTCARLSTGHVTCWGDNSWGQLGGGYRAAAPSASPVMVLPPTD